MVVALAIDWPTAALGPVSGTSSAMRWRCASFGSAVFGRWRDRLDRRGGGGACVLGTMVWQPASRTAPNSAPNRAGSLPQPAVPAFRSSLAPQGFSLPWHTSCPHHSRPAFISLQARSATCPIYPPARRKSCASADLVAVEDTRVSAKLLRHAGSDRPMLPYP